MYPLAGTRPAAQPARPAEPEPEPAPRAPVSGWFIALSSAGVLALVTALNVSLPALDGLYARIYRATAHLVTPTLLISGVLFAAVMAALVAVGRLRPQVLGWQRSKLAPALALTAGLWILLQLVEAAAALASRDELRISPEWTGGRWATTVGVLLGMALAVAPAEETFFRGFLLPQLRLSLRHLPPARATGVAVVASQLLFAIYHLPNLVLGNSGRVGTAPADIATQLGLDLLIGLVYAGLYLRTGNLFLVMGVHALQNAGTSLVATPIDASLLVFTFAVVLLLALLLGRLRAGSRSGTLARFRASSAPR